MSKIKEICKVLIHHTIIETARRERRPQVGRSKQATNLSALTIVQQANLINFYIYFHMDSTFDVCVLGSANSDLFLKVTNFPKEGETIDAQVCVASHIT